MIFLEGSDTLVKQGEHLLGVKSTRQGGAQENPCNCQQMSKLTTRPSEPLELAEGADAEQQGRLSSLEPGIPERIPMVLL